MPQTIGLKFAQGPNITKSVINSNKRADVSNRSNINVDIAHAQSNEFKSDEKN